MNQPIVTTRRAMDTREWRALCGAVAFALPHISWRHSGLGVLQGYLHEGTEHELRVHVWHRSLRRPGIDDSGLLHDHRFDLDSQVLVGTLHQDEYQLRGDTDGHWVLYEVLHARAKYERSGGATFHEEPTLLTPRFTTRSVRVHVPEGYAYHFPKRQFHGTRFDGELAVTLLTKSNQDELPARILAPLSVPLVHAFSDPLPRDAWVEPLRQAHEALVSRWSA